MRYLLILAAAFWSFFAQAKTPTEADARAALKVLGTGQDDAGSVLIATDPEHAAELGARLGVTAHTQLVAITGQAAVQASEMLAKHGVKVAVQGDGDQRLLVFVDDDCCGILKIIKEAMGDALDLTVDGIILIKGGLGDILDCLEQALGGAIDLGIDFAALTCRLVRCSFDCALQLAECVWECAGTIVVKTAEGVVIAAQFMAEALCDVIHGASGGAWCIAKWAVGAVWRVEDGALEAVDDAADWLCQVLCGCDSDDVRVHLA